MYVDSLLALSRTLHADTPYLSSFIFFFFFNDTATTEIYTLSLHDALPICADGWNTIWNGCGRVPGRVRQIGEHTSELQSRFDLVCRLLLEKKKKIQRH